MQVWYATSVISLYGIGVFIYVTIVFASADAQACLANQKTRYEWLMVEVIYFFTLFGVFQFVFALIRCFKKETLHEILNKEDDEDEDWHHQLNSQQQQHIILRNERVYA